MNDHARAAPLSRAHHGDDRIDAKLVQDLLNYFLRRTDSVDDATECLSETLLVLWRRRRALPDAPVEARMWAFGIARNVLASERRKTSRRSAAAVELVEAVRITTNPAEPDVDLQRALNALTPADRELVMLIAWDGFGVAEAGKTLGLKPDAARARYSRVRARLRSELGDE